MQGLFRQVVDGFQDGLPTGGGGRKAADVFQTLACGLRHVVPQMGFIGHFGGVVDEVSLVVAEPAGPAVLYHLLPAAAVVHDEDAAAGHGFQADAGPIFRGVCGLEDDLTVLVEVLLGDFHLVACGPDPVVGLAYFFGAAFVKAEEEAFLGFGGDEVFIDAEGIAGEFIRVLAGDAAAAEVLRGALADEGEVVMVEVGAEGVEGDAGIVIEGAQDGHVFLPDGLVLVQEHGDLSAGHGFLFLFKEPGHAVDKDRPAGAAADVREVVQEFLVAEAKDGVAGLDGGPVAGGMDVDAPAEHIRQKGLMPDIVGGDDVDFPAHGEPGNDLVVEFRACSAIEGGEAEDEDSGNGFHVRSFIRL